MTLSFELSGQLKSLPSVYNTTRPTGEKTGPLQVKERSREARRHRIGMPKTRHGFLRHLFAVCQPWKLDARWRWDGALRWPAASPLLLPADCLGLAAAFSVGHFVIARDSSEFRIHTIINHHHPDHCGLQVVGLTPVRDVVGYVWKSHQSPCICAPLA